MENTFDETIYSNGSIRTLLLINKVLFENKKMIFDDTSLLHQWKISLFKRVIDSIGYVRDFDTSKTPNSGKRKIIEEVSNENENGQIKMEKYLNFLLNYYLENSKLIEDLKKTDNDFKLSKELEENYYDICYSRYEKQYEPYLLTITGEENFENAVKELNRIIKEDLVPLYKSFSNKVNCILFNEFQEMTYILKIGILYMFYRRHFTRVKFCTLFSCDIGLHILSKDHNIIRNSPLIVGLFLNNILNIDVFDFLKCYIDPLSFSKTPCCDNLINLIDFSDFLNKQVATKEIKKIRPKFEPFGDDYESILEEDEILEKINEYLMKFYPDQDTFNISPDFMLLTNPEFISRHSYSELLEFNRQYETEKDNFSYLDSYTRQIIEISKTNSLPYSIFGPCKIKIHDILNGIFPECNVDIDENIQGMGEVAKTYCYCYIDDGAYINKYPHGDFNLKRSSYYSHDMSHFSINISKIDTNDKLYIKVKELWFSVKDNKLSFIKRVLDTYFWGVYNEGFMNNHVKIHNDGNKHCKMECFSLFGFRRFEYLNVGMLTYGDQYTDLLEFVRYIIKANDLDEFFKANIIDLLREINDDNSDRILSKIEKEIMNIVKNLHPEFYTFMYEFFKNYEYIVPI